MGERLSCLWLYPKTKRTMTITDFPITHESKPNVVCKINVQHSTLGYKHRSYYSNLNWAFELGSKIDLPVHIDQLSKISYQDPEEKRKLKCILKHKYTHTQRKIVQVSGGWRYKEFWLECRALVGPRDFADMSTRGLRGGLTNFPLENVVQ